MSKLHKKVLALVDRDLQIRGGKLGRYKHILQTYYPQTCLRALSEYKGLSVVQAVYTHWFGRPKCSRCSKDTAFWSFRKGYLKYCSHTCSQLSEDVREKRRTTCLSNLSVEHPMQDKSVKDKRIATWKKRYGVDNPFQNESVKTKIKRSYRKKYGVDHPMKDSGVKRRCSIAATQLYKISCGHKSYTCQGYERFVLPELVKRYGPNDIIGQFEPTFNRIRFTDSYGRDRTYTPDLYVRSKGTYVEIKSTFTLWGGTGRKDLLPRNRELQNQANKLGVTLRFVVYSKKTKRCVLLPKGWEKLSREHLIDLVQDKMLTDDQKTSDIKVTT